MKIVPDTSVIINGVLTDLIEKEELKDTSVIIPEFVLEELRAQASRGREIGFKGLEEIKKIQSVAKQKGIRVIRTGRKQTYEEIQLAKYGRIDALIIDVAKKHHAVLYTSDLVQALSAEAEGIETRFFKPYEKKMRLKIEEFLTHDTMSLHLKEDVPPMAKRGKPGEFKLVKIRKEPLTPEEMGEIIREIMEAARYEDDAFIEIGGHSATVIQLGDKRISITRPPFSEATEITLVRPIIKVSLDNYKLAEKLKQRLEKDASGILIAGPPGSGKSTFAAALAEFYERTGAVVKTLESPRDLQVKKEITQYTKLKGSFANVADLLLLVRPDYTVFDEIRKTDDFEVFSDLRLAGIGMIGVVHANKPIDAIQRFLSRVELGMVPHIVDTVIFIEAGKIDKVYELSLSVRTPKGMTDDLARPVIDVRDFETGVLECEIYTFGEENVVLPVKKETTGIKKLAKQMILSEIKKFDKKPEIEIVSDDKVSVYVNNKTIPKIIGKRGRTISMLEKKLGVSIEVLPKVKTLGQEIRFNVKETGAHLIFSFDKPNKDISFYNQKDYIFTAKTGKDGQVKVNKKSEIGKEVMKAVVGNNLKTFLQ